MKKVFLELGGILAHLPRGYFIESTLLRDVDPASRIAQEEIFGPVRRRSGARPAAARHPR